MSLYYISAQNGNDTTGSGTQGSPWATIGKAITNGLVAGDTVYIGPGLYRESVVPTVAGTSGAHITFRGDPTCVYLTGDKNGRVRVTATDANGLPTTTSALNCNAKAYLDFYDIHFDGTSSTSNGVVRGYATATFTDCVLHGVKAITVGGTLTRCVLFGTVGCDAACTTYQCVMVTSNVGSNGGTHESSIFLGGYYGLYGAGTSYARNCLFLGNRYGVEGVASTTITAVNCLANNCYQGFDGDSLNLTLNYCTAAYCYQGFWGTSGTNKLVLSNGCEYSCCYTASRGASYESGSPVLGEAITYDWWDWFKWLEPVVAIGLYSNGTNTGAATVDMRGRAIGQGTGTSGRGCWECPDYTVSYTAGDYQTVPPGIKLNLKGKVFLNIPVKNTKTCAVDVYTKWHGITNKPQVLLQGRGISTQTATNTAAADTWQKLTVSATATEDTVLELVLYGQDSTAAGYVHFSDIAVSIT